MRILFDTNVLIASLIASGVCHELLERSFVNHTIVASDFILDELKEKLVNKFKYSTDTADQAVALFRSRMELVSPDALSVPVSRDPDDDNILAAALTGNCDYIVTGDKDLLVLNPFCDIRIVSPRVFIDESN